MLTLNAQPCQQDPRFKNVALGSSDVTIGGYGCALACIGAVSGNGNLIDLNKLLLDNGAIVNADGSNKNASLMYWLKVPNALKNLKFVWRSWTYDNDKVKDWIYNHKFPVIVEVDAAPIGAPRSSHYVVYLGDQKLFDPWTGTIRPTSDFPTQKGYILYEVKKNLTDAEKLQAIQAICNSTSVADQQIKDIKAIFS